MPIIEDQNGYAAYQFPQFQGFYPMESFPASLRDPILETNAILRVPVELAAHAALGVVSLVCQPCANVQCPSYDPAPLSLFLMVLSNTSGGKSTVEQRYLRAVIAFERKQEAEIEVMMSNFRSRMKIWEDDGRRLTKEYRDAEPESPSIMSIKARRLEHEKECPVKPKKRELRYAEISPQGLRDTLVANDGVGILSPEAGPTLLGTTFSQPAILSGYWSGEDRPVGLVSGNRRPVYPRLTVSLMTQNNLFSSYMNSRGADAFSTGLLSRILFASPQTFDWYLEPTQIDDLQEPMLDKFNQRVADILNQPMLAPDERITLKLSDVAKHYWKWFKESVQKELICGNFSEDLKSFFRKIGQQAARLAALFHYFEGATGDISSDAMKGAINLCEWYLWECIRIFTPYAPSQQQQDAEVAQKLLQWLQEATAEPWRYHKLTPGRYTERDLRNYAKFRGNPQVLEIAIMTLMRQGHVALQSGPKGGRIIFYPAWTAPNHAPVNTSLFSQPIQPNFNVQFNGAPVMAMQSSIVPMSLFGSYFAASTNNTLYQGVQEISNSVNATNSTLGCEDAQVESEQMREVRLHLEKRAKDANIGPCKMTASIDRS